MYNYINLFFNQKNNFLLLLLLLCNNKTQKFHPSISFPPLKNIIK
jgi:hypothetical protein